MHSKGIVEYMKLRYSEICQCKVSSQVKSYFAIEEEKEIHMEVKNNTSILFYYSFNQFNRLPRSVDKVSSHCFKKLNLFAEVAK